MYKKNEKKMKRKINKIFKKSAKKYAYVHITSVYTYNFLNFIFSNISLFTYTYLYLHTYSLFLFYEFISKTVN